MTYSQKYKKYKLELNKLFKRLKPDIVLSTSDLFFTTRYFSIKYPNIPLLLIQPCFLDLWERPYLNSFSKKIVNLFFPYFFEKQQYFGLEIKDINLLLWDLNSYETYKSKGKSPFKILNPTHLSLSNKGLNFNESSKENIISKNKLSIDRNKKTS